MANSVIRRLILLGMILVIGICISACSFPLPKPEEGVWYCEELMIEIDFDVYHASQTQPCAKKYSPDGTYQNVLCRFDYGNIISICSEDQQKDYLIGRFVYRNSVFSVTTISGENTYVFERIDEQH